MGKSTAHIKMNTHECIACWKCVEDCPKSILKKKTFPGRKHAITGFNAKECIGCFKCMEACPQGVFTKIEQ